MVLPALILQKPSSRSKTKEHSECILRRLEMWRNGDLNMLMREVNTIQRKLVTSQKKRSFEDTSRIFAKLVMEGKLSAALKFLDKESSSGVLILSDVVKNELLKKHPDSAPITENALLFGPIDFIPSYIFNSIDEQSILKASMRTKGSAGPSGMDSDLYRRILCSKNFKTAGKDLREEIAQMAKNLATQHYDPQLLEAYVSSRLIPLDKNPGIRPIGVGEVLRRIIGKVIAWSVNTEIKEAAGPLQTCAGHNAGSEAAIHAMRNIFENESTDAVLLIDAENAFNSMNRSVALHNIQIICPVVSTYIINTYRKASRLFITGSAEIESREGTTQGDPLAMPWYSLNTSTTINYMNILVPSVKQVWLADDAAAGGNLKNLHSWYENLVTEGHKSGYHVNGSKSWLIVKSQQLALEAKNLFGTSVNITAEGKRHLGAVIGSKSFKDEYCEEKVKKWSEELTYLTKIATSQPHAAYTAFTKGYRSKFTFFMRTIQDFEDYLEPIEAILNDQFIPTIFGQEDTLPGYFKNLLSLSPGDGGLGIPVLKAESHLQYTGSKAVTKSHVDSIINQSNIMSPGSDNQSRKEILSDLNTVKKTALKEKIDLVDSSVPKDLSSFIKQARDKGASSWLNALPIEQQGFDLNKEEFRDALRLRYNLPLKGLPSFCTCGETFTVSHALSCKKGGFVSKRHDNIRDLITSLLNRVCHNVQAEPHLIPITDEVFRLASTNTSEEARLDIKANDFWRQGQTAFFDVRITHVNSLTNESHSTEKIFHIHENEKKRAYNQRIMNVEHGTFTPLVMGTNGGMGKECIAFLQELAKKISLKQNDDYPVVMTWLRTKLSFEILRSTILCVRGSRRPWTISNTNDIGVDFLLNSIEAELL